MPRGAISSSALTRRQRWGRQRSGELVEQPPIDNADASARLELDHTEALEVSQRAGRDFADGSDHRSQVMSGGESNHGVHRSLPRNHAADARDDMPQRQLASESAQGA